MTFDEKEALLLYLEARLFEYCTHVEQNLYNGNVGVLYDGIYDILSDMEETLEAQIELGIAESTKKST